MKGNFLLYRGFLLVDSVLMVFTAIMIVLGVIPPAKLDTYPGVPHNLIAGVLWVIILLNLFSAFLLYRITTWPKKQILELTSILLIIGIIVLILGLILADGSLAWQDHGVSMKYASILAFICAVIDFLTGISIIIVSFLMPKKSFRHNNVLQKEGDFKKKFLLLYSR